MTQLTQQPRESLAIVGLGCVFPRGTGGAAFWDLLRAGGLAIAEVPTDRWDAAALYDADPAVTGRIVTRNGGFIDGADLFDPEFFGLSAREAKVMDPRQRLALKTAWWALEDAGIPGWSMKGRAGGVFLGAANGEFGGNHADLTAIGPSTGTGQATAVLANRVSYQLGLTGPSLVVDTACSSSLIAVHLACASLRSGECEFALAGGVSLMLRPDASVAFSRARMLASDGRCKTFSADADGYGRGEGAGIVVLKRLSDAVRAGDRIHAVILGSAVNHNGQSNGIAAPSTPAQEALIRQALADSGVDAATVDFVEAHGTGTLLGDPIEARAIGQVLGRAAGRTEPLPIGSVKSNIGHLEAAAGIAGLIKAVLVLRHGEVPPGVGFAAPNPHIDFQGLNLTVPTTVHPLPDRGRPAVGGVSSFGFGGANCHMIVAAPPPSVEAASPPDWPQLLTLSAATREALNRQAAAVAAQVRAAPGQAAPICCASHRSRSALRHRLAFAAPDVEGVLRGLDAAAADASPPSGTRAESPRRPLMLAFLFSGQGAQFPGMARELVDRFPVVRETLAEAADLAELPLQDLIRDGTDRVNATEVTQPLMFALQVGLARLWAQWGITPDVVMGHSLGDYAAAVAAGALEFTDAARLVAARGRLMAEHATPGGMVAVSASAAAVEFCLEPGVVIAVHNGPESLTIAGEDAALAATTRRLAAAGIEARPLSVSGAFHSPAMDPVLAPFREALAEVQHQPLRLPMVCNRTGRVLPSGHVLDAEFWVAHLRHPVRFADGMAVLKELGAGFGLEIGPAAVLSRIAALSVPDLAVMPSLVQGRKDVESLLAALAGLWCRGIMPAWEAVDGPDRSFAELPLYSFDDASFPLLAAGTVVGDVRVERTAPAAAPAATRAVRGSSPSQATSASVLDRLRGIVAELLETTPDHVDPSMPFLEMGADSLVLITATSRIEAAFGVKVPIRSFFEELSTLTALAAHLSSVGPPAATVFSAKDGPAEAPAADPSPSNFVEQVVREQLDMMRRQLDLLEGRNRASRPKPQAPRSRSGGGALPQHDSLSSRQRAHLDALIREYTARTAGSKALAERYRPVMADSRASAGFRLSIKEMLYPIACRSASGTTFEDVDGNQYLDISMGFGVHLFGHMPDFVAAALQESLARGIRLGPQSDRAGEVAERIARLSGQDRVAFLNSGTEAVMVALRLARTVTGRDKVVIFRGAYHGHFDGVLAEAADPSNPSAGGTPIVAGIAPGAVCDTLVLEYGTEESLEALAPLLDEVAAVLVEPVQSRRPDLQPGDFLRHLRRMTEAAGALLVFDELITGFRIGPGGAQVHFGVKADLVAYGKTIGGGLPIGALAGRADVMAAVDGGVWSYGDRSAPVAETTLFAGTFNKNSLTVDAAAAVLTEIERQGDELYATLNDRTQRLVARLNAVLAGTPIRVAGFGSMFRFAFSRNLDPFFYHLALRGIYIWEGRTCFLSTAHTDADCDRLVEAVADTVAALRDGDFLDAAETRPATSEMTLSQRQLAALASLDESGAAAYAVPLMLELDGPLDADRLAEAVAEVCRRHDSLWASIDPLAGRLTFADPGNLRPEIRRVSEAELDAAVHRCLERPFALDRPPLLRSTLFDLGGGRAVLLLVGHHAAVDGLSLQVLVDEIAAVHAGRPLPPAASFRALLDAHRKAEAEGRWSAARKWWMQRLQDAPAGLDLEIAAPRPAVRAFVGGRVTRALAPTLSERLRARAATEHVSLLTLLLAGFVRLLSRRGDRDLVIGVPYAGRAVAGDAAARLVGYCTHLLPLRFVLGPDMDDSAMLAAVRAALLDALDHADYPFARILEDLALRRDPSRPPLVPVTFNLDRIEAIPSFGDGLAARLRPVTTGFARFDLACNVVDCEGRLTIELDHDAALFGDGRAEQLVDSYVELLSGLVGTDTAPAEGDENPEPERLHDLWVGRGELREPVPLLTRFRAGVERDPAGPAVVADGEARLDRAALDRWSDAIADAVAGAGTGDGPVALLLPRSEAVPAAMLGCWKAGRAWVAIEPSTPPEWVAALLALAACALAVLPADAVEVSAFDCPTIVLPACPSSQTGRSRDAAPSPTEIAYILFTSGSTGAPKPVAVPHRAVARYLEGLLGRTELPWGLSYGLVSTFAADLGLTAVLPALFHGGTLCIQSDATARDPLLLTAAHRRWPIDVLKITPSHLEALLTGAPDPVLLPRRLLVLGGERTPLSLLRRLSELAPERLCVMNHYGPTEATVGVAMGLWRAGEDRLALDAPLAGARIAVLDERGDPVRPGGEGEIHVGGPQLALGYVGQAEETARRFRPRPRSGIDGLLYATGDMARLHSDGTLEVLGRRDDQVKIRGYRVEPAEVAAALQGLRQVAAAAVAVAEHPTRGPVLVAHIAPADGGVDETKLRALLAERLPAHMLPARILLCDALPLTANGKLDRAALPLPAWDDAPAALAALPAGAGASRFAAEAEAALRAVWCDLFARSDVGSQDNFFALGGDSILGIQMVARLHQSGFQLRATDLYRHPTIAALAPLLEPAKTAAEQRLLTGPVPLLPSQHRWLAVGGGLRRHANLSLLLEMAPEVTPALVAEAFHRLVAHHDGLRLQARRDGDAVVQRFGPVEAPPLHILSGDSDALDRLQALADPGGSGLVLGWLPGTPNRLLLAMHHWLVDSVSCAILLEDLAKLLRDPAAELGPKTLSLRQWGEAMAARAASGSVLDQTEFWNVCTSLPPPALPVRTASDGDDRRAEASIAVVLSERETAEVLGGPAVLAGLEVDDVLLAALTRAMGALTGEPLLYVELEGHGRIPPDDVPEPARTVGWFTTRYPAWFDLTEVEDAAAAAAVREQRLSVPNRGFDYGLLRWLGPDSVREALSQGYRPDISFNYLGQIRGVPDAPFNLASWRPGCPLRGNERAFDLPHPHRIAAEAMLLDGRLHIDLFHDAAVVDTVALTRLADELKGAILRLARLTPAPSAPAGNARTLEDEDLAALAAGE